MSNSNTVPVDSLVVEVEPKQDGTPWISTTPDTEPYLYRALPSNVGNSELDTLVGGTINWNQLASLDASGWATSGTVTFSASDKTITLTSATSVSATKRSRIALQKDHIYLALAEIDSVGTSLRFGLYNNDSYTNNTVLHSNGTDPVAVKMLFKATATTGTAPYLGAYIAIASSQDTTGIMKNVQLFDLTAMFNSSIADYIYTLESGTAGAGVAWLKKYGFLTKDYYAYDAGSLLSVKTSAHKITGKNLFDPSTVTSGKYINENGVVTSDAASGYSELITIEQATYIWSGHCGTDSNVAGNNKRAHLYDFDGNWIKQLSVTNITKNTDFTISLTIAEPNARYLRLSEWTSDTNVMLEKGSQKTTYEAFNGQTYALDSDLELRGPLALDANNNLVYDGDVYPPSGNVTRKYALVNLGDLSYTTKNVNGTTRICSQQLTNVKTPASDYYSPKAICSYYVITKVNGFGDVDKTATIGNVNYSYGSRLIINDSAITDPTQAATALNGKYLLYEVETPTTETADSFTAPQSVSAGGTEEYVDSRTVPMPVGHRTYYANIVPITGETGANLTHTGTNLLGGTDLKDAVVSYIPTASVDTTNKYVSFASGSVTTGNGLTEGVPFKENTRYTFILTLYKSSGTGSNLRLYYTDNSYDDISVSAAQTKETVVFVSDANKTVDSLRKRNSSGTTRLYYEESGIFEGVLTASQFKEYQGTTYNVTFTDQGTVYGGTYDFVSGTLRVTYANIASYNGETIGTPWLSSYEEYSVGATPTTGAQVVYPLASPQTYTLTPNVINSVLGLNYVWSDYPPVTVGYSDPFDAHNPTQYEAKPLLKLENPLTGAVINVNAFTITATTSYTGVVEIDCESQNIYSGDTNLNSIFTVSNFPVLGEGKNVITFTDADSLKIVPRWWEL